MTPVPIVDSSQLSKKRPLEETGSEDEGADNEDNEEDADGEAAYTAPKASQPKKKVVDKPAAASGEKPPPKKRGRPPGTGKPRPPKATALAPLKLRQRPRKRAAGFDAEQVAKETKINNDNTLFSKSSVPRHESL